MEYAPMLSEEFHKDRGVMRNYHAAGIGFGFDPHKHHWSHTVTCTKGSLKAVVNSTETILVPGDAPFELPAKSLHSMEVLEEGTEFYTEHPADLSGYDHFAPL